MRRLSETINPRERDERREFNCFLPIDYRVVKFIIIVTFLLVEDFQEFTKLSVYNNFVYRKIVGNHFPAILSKRLEIDRTTTSLISFSLKDYLVN